jgi:hypothetical protein
MRNIPLPSSTLLRAVLKPITLFGRGRMPSFIMPSCFVGLILRVGLNPPPVSCLKIDSPVVTPVNCFAIVVVPTNSGTIFADVSIGGMNGVFVGEV